MLLGDNHTGFYINLPIGAVVAVLLFLIHIPSKITNPLALSQLPRHLDLPGFALFAPAAIMFLLALQFGGNEHPWDSAVVIGLFVGAGVTAALFLYWERRQGDDKAMIPLGLFRSRIVWVSGVVGAFNMSITLVSSYYLPMYFQSVKGATPFQGGVDVLPTILGQLVFAVVSGALGELTFRNGFFVATSSSFYASRGFLTRIYRSRQIGILSPMGCLRRRCVHNRQRAHLDVDAVYRPREVDRLPGPPRSGPRRQHADGEPHPASPPLPVRRSTDSAALR